MDSRQQFEEWHTKVYGYAGATTACEDRWVSWQAARSESEDMKSARRDLDKAIHALTDSLDYEWTGDFRTEIEKLNGAHMRYKIKCKRART